MPLQSGSRLETGGLEFTNNYAFNPGMVNMPRDDFTVEFWAKTPAYRDRTSGNSFQSFFSYATHTEKDSTCESPVRAHTCPAIATSVAGYGWLSGFWIWQRHKGEGVV